MKVIRKNDSKQRLYGQKRLRRLRRLRLFFSKHDCRCPCPFHCDPLTSQASGNMEAMETCASRVAKSFRPRYCRWELLEFDEISLMDLWIFWVGKKESFRHTNYTPALPWHLFIQFWAENRAQTNPFPVFLPVPMLPILRRCKLVKATCGISMPTGPFVIPEAAKTKWQVISQRTCSAWNEIIWNHWCNAEKQLPVARCLRGCETNFQQTANTAWDHGTVSMQ